VKVLEVVALEAGGYPDREMNSADTFDFGATGEALRNGLRVQGERGLFHEIGGVVDFQVKAWDGCCDRGDISPFELPASSAMLKA